jgi:hypothetical protein
MRRISIKLPVILFALTCQINTCLAIKVPGYIITANHDTIYGMIRLQRFDQITGALLINGFDVESLYYKITFKSNTGKSFSTYSPGMILSFGFNYNSTDYTYKTFLVEYRSIFQNGKQQLRFLNLLHHGRLDLYQNEICILKPENVQSGADYMKYYEYFIYSDSKGLLRIGANDHTRSMQDLLRQTGMEEDFIRELPKDTEFKDILYILENYDDWWSVNQTEGPQ